MMIPPAPANEATRLAELKQTGLLDSMPEKEFDDLALLASQICGTPIALMTLLDSDRQWFKSRVAFEATETSRDVSFCAHAILRPGDTMVVPDATADPRFRDNPLVLSDPNIRFYAGTPLITDSGSALGTLCVIDRKPRTLSEEQEQALRALGRQAISLVDLRRKRAELEEEHRLRGQLLQTLHVEKKRSDQLLESIFPESVAHQLRSDVPPACVAHAYDDVTVFFADIVGFWRAAGNRPPEQLIALLNGAFSLFDHVAEQHGIDRIKTIGDAYMGISGLRPSATQPGGFNCAVAAAEWALQVQRELATLDAQINAPFSVRIGMHSGPVVAGVVGKRKLAYDIWGPTVNLASEMESSGVAGGIQVSEQTYKRLADRYAFEPRGEFYVRGQGDVNTYLLKGRLPAPRGPGHR